MKRSLTGQRVRAHQIVGRTSAALLMVSAIAFGAFTHNGSAVAQNAAVGTAAAAISPATSQFYVGFSLDMTSDQWTIANDLVARSGMGDSSTDLLEEFDINEILGSASSDIENDAASKALLGGEGALVATSLDLSDSGLDSLDLGDLSTGSGSSDEVASGLDILMSNGAAAKPAGIAVVIKPGDMAGAEAYAASELQTTASSQDVAVTDTDYNGTTIHSVPGDDDTGDTGTAYAKVGDFLVLSETPADIQPFIDTAAGTVASLATGADFARLDSALSGDRLAFGYFNGEAVLQALSAAEGSGFDMGAMFGPLLGNGANTGMAVVADPLGLGINSAQINLASATPAQSSDVDLSFADKVPSDTLVFANGSNLGQGVVLQAVGLLVVTAINSVVSSISTPEATPSIDDMYTSAAALLGFNLKTSLLDQLTGEYGFALWGVSMGDSISANGILTSGVAQAGVLADALSKISLLAQAGGQGNFNVTTRQIDGSNVSVINLPADSGFETKIEYGVVGDEFLLGVGDGIDQYLAGPDGKLSDNPDYQAALAALPSDYDTVIYVDSAAAAAIGESAASTSSFDLTDASEKCSAFATQADAQAAYDADSLSNFDLDSDFDGQACEDYFAPATPEATPVAPSAENLGGFATVIYEKDGITYSNSIQIVDAE